MKKLFYYSLFLLLAFFPARLFSQSAYSAQDQVRAINKHFLGEQLKGIAEHEPARYAAIQYYFKSSFEVSVIDCPSCEVDSRELFNQFGFDVTEFEAMRLVSESVEFDFKDKYKIVLLPKDEVNQHVNDMDVSTLLSRKVHRPFPEWSSTYTAADFPEYMELVKKWERDFPDEFKAMYYTEGFSKLPFSEFQELSAAEQNEILTNQSGYLLLND